MPELKNVSGREIDIVMHLYLLPGGYPQLQCFAVCLDEAASRTTCTHCIHGRRATSAALLAKDSMSNKLHFT